MKFRTMAAAVAALTLTTSPVLAQATVDRSVAPIEGESELGGRGSSSLLLILAIVLFGAGIYFLVDNDDDEPNSP